MKKGDKLRVIVRKSDKLLLGAGLRKGQTVRFMRRGGQRDIYVADNNGDHWVIYPKAVEEVSDETGN